MGAILTQRILERAELRKKRLKEVQDLKNGSEELNLDPKTVMQLFQEPIVHVQKDQMAQRLYITGTGLIPMNLDEILEDKNKGRKPETLHLELVEHSEIITERTITDMGKKDAEQFILKRLDRLKFHFNNMYADIYEGNSKKLEVIKMPFKIFRSKLSLDLKEKYGIKNL